MSSTAVDEAVAALDAVALHAAEPSEMWDTRQRLDQLERIETLRRTLPALEHELINQLGAHALPEELGGKLSHALANRLRISRTEASRRIHEADDLGPRRTLTGEPLEPALSATAAGQHAGLIGGEHVRVIRGFLHQLPAFIDDEARDKAERDLADKAGKFRPDELRRYADRLALVLNPDGNFSDADRARRRGVTLGPQGLDGMSPIRGYVNPELRAGLDAVFAKLAAHGMCNPEDQTPRVDGAPSDAEAKGDDRSAAQRNHDALGAMVRSTLMSGELGSHRGLPVSIVATTTIQELTAKAGLAHTGGGTVLPMTDVIRMAAHAWHYLLIYDGTTGRPLYLGKTKRLASADQRIVLHALDRGCTHPGCDVPGYLAEVHHVHDWVTTGRTDIDDLTFACPGQHHPLVTPGGWQTRKLRNGQTAWIPPPHLDHGQPRTNDFHHPERFLPPETDDTS